jgi:hypothetical protein
MDDTCILYIHGNSWDGVPARQRYLMEQMSRRLPIIFLEDTEDRRWRVTWKDVQNNVTVGRGLMPMLVRFELRGWKWAQRLWCWRHLGWVRKKYRRIILWEAENWLRGFRFLPRDRFIFDCIDPSFSDNPARRAAFDRRDEEMCQNADLVFASADSLADKCRKHNHNVVLLNNACAPEEYKPALLESARKPAWWPKSEKPVAAYLGTLDARFDFAAVETACKSNSAIQFILAGTIHTQMESRVRELAAMENVICPGRISVEDGRYLLSHCQISLIPFVPGEMNDAVNPVKMYAYALLGKPMVGTAVRELRTRPEIAFTAQTPAEFAKLVADAMAGRISISPNKLNSFALQNTWEARADQAMKAIERLWDER